jgi:hypothetical protein
MKTDEEIVKLYHELGTYNAVAEVVGCGTTTVFRKVKQFEEAQLDKGYILPEIPDDDLPIEDVIDHLKKRFSKRKENKEAKHWMNVDMKSDMPIGLLWLGDPHIDDNYCDWGQLTTHVDLIKGTDGLYGCSVGDYQNNWIGRLARLYAEQDTSSKTAWRLVEWLISNMDPLILIGGNHDMWSGSGDPLKWIAGSHTIHEEWECKVSLNFPNGRKCRIHAAHDMSGHSQWNSLHGQTKMARFKQHAELYISGHRHNWGLAQIENVERKTTSWLARARGYKFHDTYAVVKGFDQQNFGQAILQVIDPHNDSPVSWVQCFADPLEGVDYLQYRRQLRQ